MNKILKNHGIVSLAAVLLFSMAACVQDANDSKENGGGTESPYLGYSLNISGQQVWTRNRFATKVSQVYLPYSGHHYISAFVFTSVPDINTGYYKKIELENAGGGYSGLVSGGILKFKVEDRIMRDRILKDNILLLFEDRADCGGVTIGATDFDCDYHVCDYLKCYSNNYNCGNHKCINKHETYTLRTFFREWNHVEVNPAVTKGNVALLESKDLVTRIPDGVLDRQRITGTATTITCETILYLYVTDDCRITGEYNTGFIPGNYYYSTEGGLDLTLKEGWNLVSRTETYGTNFNGHAKIGMMIRNHISNPESYKWTIEQGFTF